MNAEDNSELELTITSKVDNHVTLENGEVEIPKAIQKQKDNNFNRLKKAKEQLQ